MSLKLSDIWSMIKTTAKNWNAADPFRESAVISYYAIFSIPGLLMIVIWVAGAFFGTEAIQGEVSTQVSQLLGRETGAEVEELLKNVALKDSSLGMKIIGIASLVFGSTTLFFQLQKSLNYIWEVEGDPQNNWTKLVRDRVSSLGLVLVIAFLLLITLVLSAVFSLLSNWLEGRFGEGFLVVIGILNFLISLGLVTVLFAIMYKVLPDVDIQWKSVWVGALVTALLFTVGKTLLGWYFAYADPSSSYGAAGTVILIMLWVNYTCQILFFGAEFTQVYAKRYGHSIQPSEHARWNAEVRLQRYLAQHKDEKEEMQKKISEA